jgi:hypothetical protein
MQMREGLTATHGEFMRVADLSFTGSDDLVRQAPARRLRPPLPFPGLRIASLGRNQAPPTAALNSSLPKASLTMSPYLAPSLGSAVTGQRRFNRERPR